MINCTFCDTPTTNPRFCSRSCAAKLNNKTPKRKAKIVIINCAKCEQPVEGKRRKYCETCRPNYVDWSTVSFADVRNSRLYQKNSRVRTLARTRFKKKKQTACAICGYAKHIEVCHIKPINTYPDTATVDEINKDSNLIGLCPNHHWELDHGLLVL